MKRYRICNFDFDSRSRAFDPIQEGWDEQVKALHITNRDHAVEELRNQYGEWGLDQKVKNFIDLGVKPFSVIAFHNHFYEQARSAFVAGHYYPALTSVVALGERVLNHLVLGLRHDFKASSSYKKVFQKKSFDNWKVAIDALVEWQVLTPDAKIAFDQLREKRNHALHFNPEVQYDARTFALEALESFGKVIDAQFSAFGLHCVVV